jgi:uncharacterized protein DUF6798
VFTVLGLVFGLAHTQAPLYYSNQHQYFLHGLARARLGHLDHDWLAGTADPTPLFSALVAFTHRYLHDALFQVYYLLLLALYCYTLVGVFRRLSGRSWSGSAGLLFLMLLTFAHCGAARLFSAHRLGKDYPWYLQAGIAGQYVLGPGLQPSVSGVLLLAAVYLFLSGRPWLAAAGAALAADVHSTYLLTSAQFIAAFMAATWARGQRRLALQLGAGALLLVLPVIAYDLLMFAPTSPGLFAEAQRIIAHERIPHHAEPRKWFDALAVIQIGWIILAVALARRSALCGLMAIVLGLATGLTLLQIATDSDTLALLFPWRATAVLVPLATAVIFTRAAAEAAALLPARPTRIVCGVALVALAAAGIALMASGVAYRTSAEELPLLDYVREHQQGGDLYLLPVEVPKLQSAPRGVVSTSFTPPPKRDRQQGLISVDLQRFRLYTGAPIFVDFKAIPYKDTEVIEWWERIQTCQRLYQHLDWSVAEVRDVLKQLRITHVVATARRPLRGLGEPIHRDENYLLYRVP